MAVYFSIRTLRSMLQVDPPRLSRAIYRLGLQPEMVNAKRYYSAHDLETLRAWFAAPIEIVDPPPEPLKRKRGAICD